MPSTDPGAIPSPEALVRAQDLRLDRLLLPLDGSDEAEQSIPYAAILARKLGGEINLFHCLQPMHPVRVGNVGHIPYPDAQHDRGTHLATAYLGEIKARLKPHGLNARWNVATGNAAHLISYRAATGKFGLTLVSASTKPRVVRGIKTNTTAELWRLTAGPLFLLNRTHIRLNGDPPPYPDRIFVPVNEADAFEAAIPIATTLASVMNARFTLLLDNSGHDAAENPAGKGGRAVNVTPERRVAERIAEELRGKGYDAGVEDTAGGVIGVARRQLQERGSWIVAGSHMRSGLGRVLRGSKGATFLRRCRGPLIVVPTASVAKQREKRIRKKVASAESVSSIG